MSCAFMHVIDVPFANHSGTVILAAPINKSIITGLDFVQRQWINAMALTDKEVQTMAIGVHRFSQDACHVQIYLHCPVKIDAQLYGEGTHICRKAPNCIATLISHELTLQGRELIPQNICQVRKGRGGGMRICTLVQWVIQCQALVHRVCRCSPVLSN